MGRNVILYMKPECHLCDEARAWLDEMAAEPEQFAAFDLTEVDIRRDSAIFAEYRHRIPVIVVDSTPVAEGRMDDAAYQAIAQALRISA